MTGSQILAAFESIGAVVRLTPAGIVDIDAPDVPEFERLVAEAKANRSEVVALLRNRPSPAHPCVCCGRASAPEDLFCRVECFDCWKAERAARRRKAGAAP